MGHEKYKLVFLLIVGLFVCTCFTWLFILPQRLSLQASPSELFVRYILDPIPASVQEIKASRTKEGFGFGYAFRFKISRGEVDVIINSRPFNRVSHINYENDVLLCRSESAPGLTTHVYPAGVYKPAWFKLEEWADPEAYLIYETTQYQEDLWLLVYNENLGEAYFLVRSARG